MKTVDLFAGPGGWSEGLRALGLEELGVEWDEHACATARAAGHDRLQADVAALDPLDYPCDLLIASPPCQAYSMAGKGGGRRDVQHVVTCARELAEGKDTRAEHAALCEDPRSMLVVEALRWPLLLRPMYVACEQVPPVLELWALFAEILREQGYSVWTGLLSSETFGVPQTRKRAILMARRDGKAAQPPPATHHPYKSGQPRPEVSMDLFGEGLLPWVSMAEALGWGMNARPALTVSAGTEAGGADTAMVGGSGARKVLNGERERGAWLNPSNGRERTDGGGPTPRSGEQPAPTVTSEIHGQWRWVDPVDPAEVELVEEHQQANQAQRTADQPAQTLRVGGSPLAWNLRANAQGNATVRGVDEPAPTITGGNSTGERVWEPTHFDRRQTGGDGTPVPLVPVDRPAPTITASGVGTGRDRWVHERPATTVQGDPRIAEPGWRGAPKDYDADGNYIGARSMDKAVRVSEEEAAVLQGFRADYPWQGSRTARFQQIGNAVPPPLARAIIAALTR